MHQYFEYSTDVYEAFQRKQPILALESTLITHGLPFPHNLEIATTMIEITRKEGVTPAIIAIIQGKIKIGLSLEELDFLVNDANVVKASTRDLPFILSKQLSAGTTVAATLFCADYAGIKVFATGGIGGVHRGDDKDISADLIELGRTSLAVICSGAKAILDLNKTLEFIETYGIPVVGFNTEYFPAFYTAHTPYKLTSRVDTIRELTHLVSIHWQLGLPSSLVIANPIPIDQEIPSDRIEPVIIEALRVAQDKQIYGKALTPFLLSEVAKETQGQSLAANINLIKNNVKLGAKLAFSLKNEEEN